jgi:hypothetical protein
MVGDRIMNVASILSTTRVLEATTVVKASSMKILVK